MWTWLLLGTALGEWSRDGDVLVLDDQSLDEAVKAHTFLLVEFYAPWCGHCQKLAPEYAKAATALLAHSPPLPIAKVDATVNPVLTQRYDISSFPTLKFFYHGKPREYDGGRIAEEISYWVREQIKPAAKSIESAEGLKSFIAQDEICVVLFAAEGSVASQQFEISAKDSGKKYFAWTHSAEVAEEFSVKQPTLVLFNHKEDTRTVFAGEWSDADITNFLADAKLPLVFDFSPAAIEYAVANHHPIVFVFRPDADSERLFPILLSTAKAESKSIRFCHCDLSTAPHRRLGDFLGIAAGDQPTALLLDTRADRSLKYKYTETEISEESLRRFIGKWREGKLTAFYKTEGGITAESGSAVRKLSADDYESVTGNPNSGVLVMLYTDWCVKCKRVDLDAVAKAVSARVTVGEVDMMKNDLRSRSDQSFPVLLWYPPTPSKSPIQYDGKFKTEAVVSWLQSQLPPSGKTDL